VISKRQRRPAEAQGSKFECAKCGGEVIFVSVPKDGQALDVPVHVSSITIACSPILKQKSERTGGSGW